MENFFLNLNVNAEQLQHMIQMTDAILFLCFTILVGYLFLFAFKSLGKSKFPYPPANKKQKFVILFSAYKEDEIIIHSATNLLKQNYPRDKYDILVIADQMKESTNQELENLGIMVLRLNENSSKNKALQMAVKHIEFNNLKYDIAIILDANNLVENNFLDNLNDAFYSGCSVVQTHRVAKNLNTSIAILDAVSEEMNNNIFRKGHTNLGFSASLIGSGMAFEYDIFKDCIMEASIIGENKQLEMLLLKEYTYIEYLGTVYTYDEKVKKSSQFYNQRRRWIASQFYNLFFGLKSLPFALLQGNWDYANKIFQWMMPPRIILLGLIIIFSLVTSYYDVSMCIKWWGLLAALILTFTMAIPDYLINGKLLKAILNIPLLFFMMFLGLFCMSRAKKEILHTEKNN
ncbi:MAG: glycosyltransferase family 2 protein [Bacteroidaceae bacterium]